MTGFEYIVSAIDLFEADLESGGKPERIRTVTSLAGRVGYSVHHFTRLFAAVTGIAPKDYMMGRILSEAAKRIVRTDLPLAVVACEAGFADYETFSRAFRSRFGMPPKRLRDLHYIPFEVTEKAVPRMSAAGLSLQSLEPRTVHESTIHLCGLCFYMDGSEKTFHKPWAVFMDVQSRVRNRKSPERFYQYSSWASGTDPAGISILCALETEGPREQEPLFVSRSLPETGYLRFVHTGDVFSLPETYSYIYGDYLASHEFSPADSWEFQRYGGEGAPIEIFIPIA